ncbi:hypothetical protein AA671_11520 [Delftia tsuruhatensis]|uniref:hypothetical protein n=1 Tax=Delftia sp. WSY_7 TaxID=3367202 RepID=UPI0006419F6C|nr:hypothetical protein AA671_11520 [Delftia tsuruhatensis]MDR6731960.1 hypothetical protein [Delftia lacustris]
MRLVAKHTQVGYQTPGQRPGCRNCVHFEVTRHDSPVIAPRTACTRHDLEVTSGGICADHMAPSGEQVAFMERQMRLSFSPQVGDSGSRNVLFVSPEVYRLRYAPHRIPQAGEIPA